MQGHRSAIGSLPESLDFDHGAASSTAAINRQTFWNNMRNPAEHRLPDYVLPPGETSIRYLDSVGQEGQDLNGWNSGEPSSSNPQNVVSHDERKTELGWPSSVIASAGVGPRSEERQLEPTNIFSLDNGNVDLCINPIANGPLFLQSPSTDASPQNLNLNAGFMGHASDGCQVMECSNLYKSSGSGNERDTSSSSSSDPFRASSGSGKYVVEENNGRPGCSLDGRRLSCKRKAIEGNVGQSSASGSSRCFQYAESSAWHALPACHNSASGLSISTPSESILGASLSEQVNQRVGLGLRGVSSDSLPDLSMAGNAENSQRNFRMRINPPQQQDSLPPTIFSTGVAVRHSNVPSPQQSSRVVTVNQTPDLRSAQASDNTNSQIQSAVIHVPALPRTVQSVRGGRITRPGNSSSSLTSGERIAALREEASLRNTSTNILENPMFVPPTELRNLTHNSTNRSLTGGSISIPGNVASTSRIGTSSGHPSSAPGWVPHLNPPSQYPRRLSDYVRRSLLSSSLGSESGGPSSSYSPLHSGPSASSQEVAPSSGANNQGHHHSFPRPALWMERQAGSVLGIPYPLPTSAAAGEGRSRLVSEIRNVLDLMRRGEGLRFEDVMIVDPSVIFGVADVHDRHRDMRLDVDNMSYEELLALEERIGNVSTGLSEETILNRLKQHKYVTLAVGDNLEAEPCCICQEEYNDGEDIGTLECGHDFHTGCIKQWLMLKNLCPVCKTTGLVT